MSQKLMFLAKDITFMALGSNFEQKPSHPTLILADLGCRPVGYAARFAMFDSDEPRQGQTCPAGETNIGWHNGYVGQQ